MTTDKHRVGATGALSVPEKDANLLSISTIQAVDELAARDGRTIAKLLRTYCRSAGLT